MADQKSKLVQMEANQPPLPRPTVIEVQTPPPITETSLVITAVLVVGAYLVLGLPGLIAGVFLVVAYLKLKDGEYEKAIRYNRIARVVAIIFLVVGISLTILCMATLFIYYAIVFPFILSQ